MEQETVRRVHVEMTWRNRAMVKKSVVGEQIGTVNRGGINGGGRWTTGHGMSYRVRNYVKLLASWTSDNRRMACSRSDGLR